MPRPRNDGSPARMPNKRRLTDLFVASAKPTERAYVVWDMRQRGLALAVQVTGGKSWKVVYHHGGRPRWYTIGNADGIGLADARQLAAEIMLRVARGEDPQASRKAARGTGTFGELAARYVEEYAKKRNKSWRQADALVRRHLLPSWGKLVASDIARTDVKAAVARIEAPVVANQALASASAVFAWAIREEVGGVKANPCHGVSKHETRSRERVLSDSEIPRFWAEFDPALKLILLTGQRPGEVSHMRHEHIEDGWWTLPGDPVPALDWPGTKNGVSHRVWVPEPALALLDGFFDRGRGHPMDAKMRRVCLKLGTERATPHDLRRSHGTMITRLGFGRDAMNRIQNHREGGIANVYDQHRYADENKKIMETVARHIVTLAEGGGGDNVIAATFRA
jgi:integrase